MSTKNLLLEAVTIEQLKKLVEQSVRDSYYQITCDLRDKFDKEDLMTRNEAAEFLRINLSTLYYWTKSGKVNCYGIANRRYYKKSEIIDTLYQYQVGRR